MFTRYDIVHHLFGTLVPDDDYNIMNLSCMYVWHLTLCISWMGNSTNPNQIPIRFRHIAYTLKQVKVATNIYKCRQSTIFLSLEIKRFHSTLLKRQKLCSFSRTHIRWIQPLKSAMMRWPLYAVNPKIQTVTHHS